MYTDLASREDSGLDQHNVTPLPMAVIDDELLIDGSNESTRTG